MLEKIREGSQGPWAVAIVGLIVLSFIFTGVGSYLGGSTSNAVASVNGEEISEQMLETAYQNERARMESQFGEAVSAMFANEEMLSEFKANILDRLINERLVQQKAFELGLRVGDEQIKQAIVDMPEFEVMGQFDNDTYQARLRQAGYQPSEFRDLMREQMTTQQLNSALGGTAFALDSEVSKQLALRSQTRDAALIELGVDGFEESVILSDEEIQAYYQSNIERFETQEQVKLAYVSLEVSDLLDIHSVSDDEVQSYYDQNAARYQTEEERRVSHILVEFNDDESEAEEKANSLLQQLESGSDFAELAEAESADIVSAESGGDLDFITEGMMGESFEEAAFGLQNVGDYTQLVRTEFGFHIIKLTDIKPSIVTELAQVSDEIRQTLLNEKARDTFFEYQEQMAALAFEVPDTLDEVANVFEGTVFETQLFERGRLPAAVSFPQIEGIAFSSELVDEGVNSDLLEISNDKVMVVRVADHRPVRTLQLDEVKDGITAQLKQDKAQALALEWLETLKSALEQGDSIDGLIAEKGVEWNIQAGASRSGQALDPAVADTLFELSPNEGKNLGIATKRNGDIALVRLDSVNVSAEVSAEEIESAKSSFASNNSRKGFENFVAALREEATIELFE